MHTQSAQRRPHNTLERPGGIAGSLAMSTFVAAPIEFLVTAALLVDLDVLQAGIGRMVRTIVNGAGVGYGPIRSCQPVVMQRRRHARKPTPVASSTKTAGSDVGTADSDHLAHVSSPLNA